MNDEPTVSGTLRWWIESILIGLVLIGIFRVVSTIVRALLPESSRAPWIVFSITLAILTGSFLGLAEMMYGDARPKYHPSANYTPQQMRAYVDRKCTQQFTDFVSQFQLDDPQYRQQIRIKFECRFHDEGDMPAELVGRALLQKIPGSIRLNNHPFNAQESIVGYNQYYTDDAARFLSPAFRTSTDKDAYIIDKTRK